MTYHTDHQLVRDWLKNFWAFTSVCALVMFLLVLLGNDRGLFAAQFANPLVDLLSIDIRSPFRYFGLNWITSAFVHSSFVHLASNLFWLLGFGIYVEKFKGPWKMVQVFALGHLAGALLACLFIQEPDVHYILGASSGTLSLIGYCAGSFKKFFFYFAAAITLALLMFFSDNSESHVLPLVLGALFGRLESLRGPKP